MRPTPQNQDAMPLARRSERNAKGQYLPGVSGNPGGSPEATRRAFNKRFLLDLAEDWQQHGREVFKRVRRESPASYLKVCAMLVPREMKLEHSGGVKAMSDEALENAIEALERMLGAKVIEGVAEPVPVLPPPSRKARRKVRRSDRADSGLAATVVGTDSTDGKS